VELDPRERFTVTAEDFARYRPGYPDALRDWLGATCGLGDGAHVVDLGCGTGIASRWLAARWRVTGVEPNQAMLEKARAAGEGPRLGYVRGAAEETGLPDGCADLVSIANALHWFDAPRALAEIARLAAPGGWAAAYWNGRADSPFNDDYEALLRGWSEDYRTRFPGPERSPLHILRDAGLELIQAHFTDEHRVGRDAFIGLAHSASYVAHGVTDLAAFDAALEATFARHAAGGVLVIPMRCDVQAWRPRIEESVVHGLDGRARTPPSA
jgi:SAM-dependent methyltransferase